MTSLTTVLALLLAGLQPAQPAGQPQDPSPAFTRVYKPDTPGLTAPVAVHIGHLLYTPEAMRAKVQGEIVLELTVGADGRVRDAMVKKSLDSTHGLDEQGVAAAAKSVFEPGRLNGTPVAVRVELIVSMHLRDSRTIPGGHAGDNRHWADINAWAEKIARALRPVDRTGTPTP
jgi:TonB family protein